jgi:hypothetical protein
MFTRNSTSDFMPPEPLKPGLSAGPNKPPAARPPSLEAGKSVISNDLKIIGQSLRIISRGTLQVDGEVAAGSIERSKTSANHHIVAAAPPGAPNVKTVCSVVSSQTEPMPRQLAGFIARFTSTANLGPLTVDSARRRNADLTNQGGATIAVALHASKMVVGKRTGDATEIAIVLGRKSGPVARKRTASAAAPTERGCFR